MSKYRIKYKIESKSRIVSTVINVRSGTESEAIEKLKKKKTWLKNETITILEFTKA